MRVKSVIWTLLLLCQVIGIEAKGSDGSQIGNKPAPTEEDESSPKEKSGELPNVDMPEPLTMNDFDKTTAEQLSFVEFFSPYCSHCKQLAPTWEKAYKEYYNELTSMNIQMRQVNCVESGDLCEREEVFGYPSLRIYAPVHDKPSGTKTGKSKFVSEYPRSLVRTVDNFKKFIKNAVAEYDNGSIDLPSASKPITLDRFLELLAGKAEQPEFVMLYPGTQDQWDASEGTGKNGFSRDCYDCMDHKRIWDKLSNRIITTVGTSHFSCVTNAEMCEKLGYHKLTSGSGNPPAKFLMFLPKKAGIIKFEYKGMISVEDLKDFATRLFENSQYETVSPKTLSEIMDFRKSLPQEPLNLYYPLPNKVSIVFYYDPHKTTEEDRSILPYLLEYVTYSPFNIHLFTAKSNKYEGAINSQASNILEYINNANGETESKLQFNKARYLSTTLTTKPTILIIKDNTLFTSVFQSYGPEDIRNEEKVIDFISRNQFPLYQELTRKLKPYYFPEKITDTNKDDKVVITFINSNDARQTDGILSSLSLIAHEYHEIKNEYYFNDIVNKRESKAQRVAELKKQNANSVAIIQEMRREVPRLFDNNDVLFTFIDLANQPEFASDQGWNINSKDYQPGDTLVVTKDNYYYWDQNLSGASLVIEPNSPPKDVKNILKYLLDATLITDDNISMTKKLVGSPYSSSLRFMDYIHARGFWGYLLVIVAIITLVKLYNRRKAITLHHGNGIIGNLDKAD